MDFLYVCIQKTWTLGVDAHINICPKSSFILRNYGTYVPNSQKLANVGLGILDFWTVAPLYSLKVHQNERTEAQVVHSFALSTTAI